MTSPVSAPWRRSRARRENEEESGLGGEEPPPGVDGRGRCFVETGKKTAALVEGDFFASPEPRVAIQPPSARHAEDKHPFESERLARWFGG